MSCGFPLVSSLQLSIHSSSWKGCNNDSNTVPDTPMQFSMLSLGVTQYLLLLTEERRLQEKLGALSQRGPVLPMNFPMNFLCLPSEVSEGSMLPLEQFVLLMYDWTSESMEVNDARNQLFSQKSRTLDNIPPTQAALKLHIKLTCYQAKHWSQALVMDPEMPEPTDWNWTKETTRWQSLCTILPEASCLESISCHWKKGCTGRCMCAKAALKCTALCLCCVIVHNVILLHELNAFSWALMGSKVSPNEWAPSL